MLKGKNPANYKRKNILWRKWKIAQSNGTDQDLRKRLEKSGVKLGTFYKHCENEICRLSFDYIKIYADVFGLTLNELANE
jgi:hypothetical protein